MADANVAAAENDDGNSEESDESQRDLGAASNAASEISEEDSIHEEEEQQHGTMSGLGVHPPEILNMNSERLAEDFRDFQQAWEIFVLAAEIGAKSDAVKVALLKNFLGMEAVKVLNTLLVPANQNTPAAVLTALEGYCLPQSNETYERFLFNTATQQPNEDINQYVSRLRTLAATCNYADLKDSLIRDRIVVGIKSDDTRKALLKTANLTLATAIDTCRAQKLVEDRMTTMKIKEEPVEPERGAEVVAKVRAAEASTFCKYCGRKDHRIGDRESCPANGAKCRNCGKLNHFAKVCRAKSQKEEKDTESASKWKKKVKKVKAVEEEDDEDSEESEYITSVEVVSAIEKRIMTDMELSLKKKEEPQRLRCQIDTGASCNVITLSDLKTLGGKRTDLDPSMVEMKGFGGQLVPAIGQVFLRHMKDSKCYKLLFQVVDLPRKVLQSPLLGSKTCIALGFISVHIVNVCGEEEKEDSTKIRNPEGDRIVAKFEDVFSGDGRFEGAVDIELNDSPPKQQEPRRVPISLRQKLQNELQDLEKRGIVEKVEDFTEWTSNIVIVCRNDKVRICLDPVHLNKAIKRPRLQMTTLEEILPELHNVKVFSKLDVRNGFWHVQLTEKSSRITAFWTPYGRYVWKRLPFGLSSSPEIFQQKLQQALHGLVGIEVLVDDILVTGRGNTEPEAVKDHNRNLLALLQRCRAVGIKLNKAKMRLNQTEVRFFGHVLSKDGLKPDPQKTEAISSMDTPKDAAELQRFLGVVNYMAKFIPKLSETSVPLREALASAKWTWGQQQAKAFSMLKKKIVAITTLKFFDPKTETTIQCDASSYALGAVLMQQGQPIMFASRVLTATEQKYAQIEKETLAILFSCKRFDQYIFGNKQVTVETDHLPLQAIFKKPLSDVPKRVQRMILSLQRYELNVKYVKGSQVIIADTLSRNIRANQPATSGEANSLWKSIEEVNALDTIELHEDLLLKIQQATVQDEVSRVLKEYIMNGWPKDKNKVEECAKPYFPVHCELVMQNGVILRGDRITVPSSSRQLVLEMLHYSHQGEQATLRRAREVVYWPNMTEDRKSVV